MYRHFIYAVLLAGFFMCSQAQDVGLMSLTSTGVASGKPELQLPGGAVLHVRIADAGALVTSLDGLLASFVPDKALPPPMRNALAEPNPILNMVGNHLLGMSLAPAEVQEMSGLAMSLPLTLSYYPFAGKQGFILSLPMSDADTLTELLRQALQIRSIEQVQEGETRMYRLHGAHPALSQDLYVACSDDRVYLCGARILASQVGSSAMRLAASSVIEKAGLAHADADIVMMIDTSPVQMMLPIIRRRFASLPPPLLQQVRQRILRELPEHDRPQIERQLRKQLGIRDIEEALDYLEAIVTSGYDVTVPDLLELAMELQGLAVGIDLDTAWQRLGITLYANHISPDNRTAAMPMEEIQAVLAVLPGTIGSMTASGRKPEQTKSARVERFLQTLLNRFEAKGLATDKLEIFAAYRKALSALQPLEAKAPWTVQAKVMTHVPPAAGDNLQEHLLQMGPRLGALLAPPSVTVLGGADAALIESHYRDEVAAKMQNRAAAQRLAEQLKPQSTDWCHITNRVLKAEGAGEVQTLLVEHVIATRGGIFGFDQHELISRQFVSYRQMPGFALMTRGMDGAEWLQQYSASPAQSLPVAMTRLLDQVPAQAHALQTTRYLNRAPAVLEELVLLEAVAHREIDAYLAQCEMLLTRHADDFDALEAALAAVEMPVTVVSLNQDETNKLFCVLPGNLRYPRPAVLPALQALLADYTAQADELGGAVAYSTWEDGAYEQRLAVNTEALATMVRTTLNAAYQTYFVGTEQRQRLQAFMVPGDLQPTWETAIFINSFWEVFLPAEEDLLEY